MKPEETKLFGKLQPKNLSLKWLTIMVTFCLVLGYISMCFILRLRETKQSDLLSITRKEFQDDSVYRFFLSDSILAKFIAILTLVVQIWISFIFIRAFNFFSI